MNARLAAPLIALCILLAAWMTAPDGALFGAKVVVPNGMELFPGDPVGKPIPVAEGRAQLAQKSPDDGPLRQLHFTLPTGEGAWLYLPAAPAETGLWVNGMIGGDSTTSRYFGPGFGPHHLSLDIPQSRLNFEENRLDLLHAEGWTDARRPLIVAVPASTGSAFGAMAERAEERLRFGAMGFGGLGLALSVLAMLLLRDRWLYAGGALYAAGLIDMVLGELPPWVRLVLMALGLALLAWRSGWRRTVPAGTGIAAALALLVAIALSAGWASTLTLAWMANTALWPIAAAGIPTMALADGRLVWADFIAARAKIGEQAALIAQQELELKDSIRSTAIAEERQRFVRDMHDGVGGHLLSLLMRVRADDADSNDVAEELEKGLTDLRLMADSLDHVGEDLDVALAAFERRARQQLSAAGLEFGWNKPQDLSGFHMDARAVLNLFRIMQEAMANSVRHARASSFGVAFALAGDGQRLDVTIEDDGIGFTPGAITEGRGLANIRKRTEKLGGNVVFGPGDGGKGCRISLSVPATT